MKIKICGKKKANFTFQISKKCFRRSDNRILEHKRLKFEHFGLKELFEACFACTHFHIYAIANAAQGTLERNLDNQKSKSLGFGNPIKI